MASILLLAVPSTFFGAAGTAAAVVGQIAAGVTAAMIDARLIMPLLFPPEDPVGPKVDDLHVMSASEGQPIPLAFGAGARTSGHLIWASKIKAVTTEASGPSKGGGIATAPTTEYYIDAAIAFTGNEVVSIDRVFNDGKSVYFEGNALNFTDDMTVTGSGTNLMLLKHDIPVGFGDESLAQLTIGAPATTSGFARADATNFSTSTVVNKVGGFPLGQQTINYSGAGVSTTAIKGTKIEFANHSTVYYLLLAETASAGGTGTLVITPALTANVPNTTVIVLSNQNNGVFVVASTGTGAVGKQFAEFTHPQTDFIDYNPTAATSITVVQTVTNHDPTRLDNAIVYTGTEWQDPSPLIEGYIGVGDVPAWRGISYIVYDNLLLRDYGNRMPNVNGRIAEAGSLTIEATLNELCRRSGMDAAWYDNSNAPATTLEGYVFKGPLSTAQAMQPVLLASNTVPTAEDGVLKFYARTSVPVVAVTTGDVGAAESGQRTTYPISVLDQDAFKVPTEVSLKFQDSGNRFQSGDVLARRPDLPHRDTMTVNLPLGMSESVATAIAYRLLWEAEGNRRRIKGQLPTRYMRTAESNLVNFTTLGADWSVFTERVDVGRNGLVQFEGPLDLASTHSWPAAGETQAFTSGDDGDGFVTSAPLQLVILDLAPLLDKHSERPGFYYAVSTSQKSGFGGGTLSSSSDGGLTYANMDSDLREARMGFTTTTLADGSVGFWDRSSTVTVTVNNGTLSSATELEVLNGANRAIVGDEVIAYQTATLVDTDTYTLSLLLRGLRDTEAETGSHATPTRFVALDRGIGWYDLSIGAVGTQRYFKATASRRSPADVVAVKNRLTGGTLLPFSVGHVTGSIDGSNNWDIYWVNRTRRLSRLFSAEGSPGASDDLSSLAYEVDIMNGSTVVRTLSVTTEYAEYLSADQTTDFGGDQSTIDIKIYQVSPQVGRGRVKVVTL